MTVIAIVGNITRTPELRFTAGGSALCSFSVAENNSWKNAVGEWEEETYFHEVTAWKELAENVAQSLDKGDRVVVVGKLKQREYEAKDGTMRRVWDITADTVGAALNRATVTVSRVSRTDEPMPTRRRTPVPVVDDDDEMPF